MAIAQTAGDPAGIVEQAIERFVGDLAAALPRVMGGLVFLALAVVGVKVVMMVVRAFLRRAFASEDPVYRQFLARVVGILLWFAVALAFLSVLGLGRIAAALGTASGFVALGVSYALSGMIEDAVAGIYLLRDPDFMPGDRITSGEKTGEVKAIELRKTRIEVDGDTLVRANGKIESEWTKHEGAALTADD
ncbi:mechanosensitive ion channel [Halostella sp. JP-L12]|uniref:mechanosensitive ion channel domain-containing protein n=1 Tax=Halostella TaxID=1843185 RepID=UPI000EF772DF|nr:MULTISPECIES: mechanosensitive ion channel domain-containing protein [Halostella]NHN48595.1 mechanosensitive ion channel [Halostella sp. JP-L12]